MVGGKEDEGQIDRSRADLHQDGIREITEWRFPYRLARECGRELKAAEWSCLWNESSWYECFACRLPIL
jgi:hypothetical protein